MSCQGSNLTGKGTPSEDPNEPENIENVAFISIGIGHVSVGIGHVSIILFNSFLCFYIVIIIEIPT